MKLSVFYAHLADAARQNDTTVENICSLAASYGISGVEIENRDLMTDGQNILAAFEHAGLEISCIYGFFDFGNKDQLQDGFAMVDLAKSKKVSKIMAIPGFIPVEEKDTAIYQKKVDRMIRSLSQICDYAVKQGVTVVLEDFDHVTAPYCSSACLKYFMDHVPNLYCTFDTGNFLYNEEDAYEVLPEFLGRIRHVHCKDRSLTKNPGEDPLYTVKGRALWSCPVGSGCIRMKEIVDVIRQNGYDDYFAIEHFGSQIQLETMRKSAEWLRQTFLQPGELF